MTEAPDQLRRPFLRSERIDLEPMTLAHLPFLRELDADPEVLRYILGRARIATEVDDYWSPICADTEADAAGLGWWVGRLRPGPELLGWWSLSPSRPVEPHPHEAEAGWRLLRRHWRQGYASEGAAVLLAYGFGSVGLDDVWAETMAVNHASRRVMSRLGMRHVRTNHRTWDDPLPGAEQGEVVYRISRPEWTSRSSSAAGAGVEQPVRRAVPVASDDAGGGAVDDPATHLSG